MELGTQIRELRQRRGITQEALAEQLNVTPQAVSKWERETALPDIQLLPAISAYFGVTIDELFALSDETRMERIRNTLWDERFLDRAAEEQDKRFLLEKGRREPDNAEPFALLAQIENSMAREHREAAAGYAKEALRRDPASKDSHSDLVEAMGGRCADWHMGCHHALIDWYKGFMEEHPDNWHACLWLLDQLLDDQRFDEAEMYVEKLSRIDRTYRTPLYRGILAWYRGDREGAMAVWEQMCADWPDEWCVWLSMGDFMARAGRFEEAKAHYRKGFALQKPPRYTDALSSIALICEMQGDWDGAIAAHEEEIEVVAEEWKHPSGEATDEHRREIARLRERKMKTGQ